MLQVLDTLIVVAWYGFVVMGSLAMLIRISRGKRSYPGQLGALPEKWVRWMLGEQPQQRR